MPRTQRLWVALAAALPHWLLVAAIQAASFCAYLLPAGSAPLDALRHLSSIPFIQAQNVLAAAALGLLAYALCANRILGWLILPVHLALTSFVLVDQLFYKIFFDHLRPSLFEVGKTLNASVAVSSISRETDAVFFLGAAIAAAGEIWLVWMLLKAPARRPAIAPWVAAGLLLFLGGAPAIVSTRYFHLNEHPVVAAARDWGAGSLASAMAGRRLVHAAADTEPAPVDRDPRLAALLESGAKRAVRPNIAMIVLESVGARNLLTENGLPSSVYAPNLASLARHGAVFNSIYAPAPATTRSHISLVTGGRLLTESSVAPLEYRYQGAMLGRSLQSLGYTTALFSSQRLDVENCDLLLKQAGYDRFQDFENDIAAKDPRNSIHSWGAREEYTVSLMDPWLDDVQAAHQPFFLEYMTVATHHPYGTPPGYIAPFAGKTDQAEYLNAIQYTDRAVGALMALLAGKGLLQNTIFVVTGDHGEAFGDVHKLNFLHKNFIYEENVRSFLLLSDPQWKLQGPVLSDRIGSNGDIMPTLLAYLGAPDSSAPGRNLLDDRFDLRQVYFFKNALPEEWGLRDGKWKFIAEIRTGRAELYDLASDPNEQRNLAAQNGQRVERYSALCEDWFIRSDAEFAARLKDYHPIGGRVILPAEYRDPGPKIQSSGVGAGSAFTEAVQIAPGQRAIVWDSWVSDGKPRHGRWLWTSPAGAEVWSDLDLHDDWTSTYVGFPGVLPMEPGEWKVQLWFEGKPALATRFTVAR